MSQVIFSQFIGAVIQLDKAMYASIQENPATKGLSVEAKFELFSPEFQANARNLFDSHKTLQSSVRGLAKSVYELVNSTGSTFEECAQVLGGALNMIYSRSYLGRMFKVGALLATRPELGAIEDIEKLSMLSRLSPEHIEKVLAEINPLTCTRKQFQGVVDGHTQTETGSAASTVSTPKAPDLKRALKKIEALAHDIGGVDADIAQAIERLKSLVSARIEATKSVETTEVKSA